MKKIFLTMMAVLFVAVAWAAEPLRFDESGRLRIMQLTDLHWMGNEKGWEVTAKTIGKLLDKEKPDLVVITGDVITGEPARKGWDDLVRIFDEHQAMFTVAMGNHDGEYLCRGVMYDVLMKSDYYVGTKGPDSIMGCGNCVIPVWGAAECRPKALLYMFDSNDYPEDKIVGEYDFIHFNQIDWYRKESERYRRENGGRPLPALAFFHIPLKEYNQLTENRTSYGLKREGIGASEVNSGLFASFLDMKDVMGVFVGHDHDNEHIGIYKEIALGYGRVTGQQAYGEGERGARMIVMEEGKRAFETYLCTPVSEDAPFYYPSGINGEDEKNMQYCDAVAVRRGAHGVAYKYYEGKCKSTQDIEECKLVNEGVCDGFDIGKAQRADYFAFVFDALLEIEEEGVYRIFCSSDDGARVYVDGVEVVENDGGHSNRCRGGKVALRKGLHRIRVKYFESYMGQNLEIAIVGKQMRKQVIGGELLYLP